LRRSISLVVAAGAMLAAAPGASAQSAQVRPGPTRIINADPASPGRKIILGRGDDARISGPKHPPIDQIPPMPMPEFRQPGPDADPGVTVYDAETRTATPLPVRPSSGLDAAQGGGSFVGALANVSTGFEMQRSFGSMSEATSLDTWPRSGNVKLVMHFIDTGGVDRWYVASGSMQDSGVVLTAAHCVYARNPDGH